MVIISEVGDAVLRQGNRTVGDQVNQRQGNRDPAALGSWNRENETITSRRQNQRFGVVNPLVFQPRAPRIPLQPPPPPPARAINPFLMRFLFEKQLHNSDVSSAGRIVIPKKLAETNLPPLIEKRGFWMHLDDMDYPQVWTFKFRFWPNNRGRMYIFENARGFIRRYDLGLGDYLMVFKDDLNESYLVRARKRIDYVPTQPMNNITDANAKAAANIASASANATATTSVNAIANANYVPTPEQSMCSGDNNNQNEFGDGTTPDYAHLIRTPNCASLDLDLPEFPG